MDEVERRGISDEAPEEVGPPELRRGPFVVGDLQTGPLVVPHVAVHPVEEERDPPDPALRQGDLQRRETAEHPAEHQVGRGHCRQLRREHDEVVDGGVRRTLDEPERAADMEAHGDVLVDERAEDRVPVLVREAGHADAVGRLGEADGCAPEGADPVDLGHRRVDVPQRRDR